MPMPFTRPVIRQVAQAPSGQLARTTTPALALPASKGVTLPYGQGVVHTVKNPAQIVPVPPRAAVT